MIIVIDVGCHPQGNEESVYTLVERFRPDLLLGFDPNPDLVEGAEHRWDPETGKPTLIWRRQLAAWTNIASVEMAGEGISAGVPHASTRDTRTGRVQAVDLPHLIYSLPVGFVLKLDCEGAEFPLLHAIQKRGLDERIGLLLVEWHEGQDPDGDFYDHGWSHLGRPDLRCPVEPW